MEEQGKLFQGEIPKSKERCFEAGVGCLEEFKGKLECQSGLSYFRFSFALKIISIEFQFPGKIEISNSQIGLMLPLPFGIPFLIKKQEIAILFSHGPPFHFKQNQIQVLHSSCRCRLPNWKSTLSLLQFTQLSSLLTLPSVISQNDLPLSKKKALELESAISSIFRQRVPESPPKNSNPDHEAYYKKSSTDFSLKQKLKKRNEARNPKSQKQFLLVYGPSGSGKTSSVRFFLESMGLRVFEASKLMVKNSVLNDSDSEYDRVTNPVETIKQAMSMAFQKEVFLGRSQMAIIIRDIPLLSDKRGIDALAKYFKGNHSCFLKLKSFIPVVWVINSNSYSMTNVTRLFGTNPAVFASLFHVVKVGKVSQQQIQTILNRTMNFKCEKKLEVNEKIMEAIALTANGDLRQALMQFDFLGRVSRKERQRRRKMVLEKKKKNANKGKENTMELVPQSKKQNNFQFRDFGMGSQGDFFDFGEPSRFGNPFKSEEKTGPSQEETESKNEEEKKGESDEESLASLESKEKMDEEKAKGNEEEEEELKMDKVAESKKKTFVFDLFYSLNKFLYNKRLDRKTQMETKQRLTPEDYANTERYEWSFSPREVVEQLQCSQQVFRSLLHENIYAFCEEIENLMEILEMVSHLDSLVKRSIYLENVSCLGTHLFSSN